MTLLAHHRSSILAELAYLRPGGERPVSDACEPPSGTPWENCVYDRVRVRIANARGAPEPAAIDREGFELRDAPTAVSDFLDEVRVRTLHYPEARELALAVTGARQAIVFDHLVRRREHDRATLTFGRRSPDGRAAANGRIHNDYTETRARSL